MHYLALCHAGRTENCANASISESVAWWQCPAESRLANQLHRGGRCGQRHDNCCGAHILFTMGTQESLMLTVVAGSWKLCVSPIINRWRQSRAIYMFNNVYLPTGLVLYHVY